MWEREVRGGGGVEMEESRVQYHSQSTPDIETERTSKKVDVMLGH